MVVDLSENARYPVSCALDAKEFLSASAGGLSNYVCASVLVRPFNL